MNENLVIHYGRVSGKAQVEGDGLERQQDATKNFCQAHGLPMVRWFDDKGVSGTVEGMDRPALVEAVEYAISHGVSAIVIERMDRIARDLMVQELFIRELKKHGLKLYSTDQGLVDMTDDTVDPTRKMIRQIMGAVAEWEKSVIVKKLRCSRDRKRAENGRCEGAKPYGFYPGEADTLTTMNLLKSQGSSNGAIARFLNESESRTRSGKPWTEGRVYDIIGRRQRDGKEGPVN